MSDWFQIIADIATNAVTWMSRITFGPLNLWQWILGFWGVSLIFIALRFFSGLSGPGLSYGVTSVFEASRNHKEDKR